MPPGRRVIYIKNPRQGSSHFITIEGGGGGGGGPRPGPRPPRSGPPTDRNPILDNVEEWLTGGGDKGDGWKPLPPGEGIPGRPAGSVTLTGGAIYNMPASNWYLYDDEGQPNYGSYEGPGVGPYEQTFSPGWIQPRTLGGQLWTIIVNNRDIYSGQTIPRRGQPGYSDIFAEKFSAYPGGYHKELVKQIPRGRPTSNPWNPFE